GVPAARQLAVDQVVDDGALLAERPRQFGGGGPAEVVEPAVAVHPRLRNQVTVAVVLAGEPHGEGAVEDVRVAGAGQRLRQLVAGDGRGGVHGPGDGVAA